MKVMVIVKASKASEAGEMPDEQLLRDMGNYNEELAKAGIMQAGEGLHPTSRGKRVHFSGKNRTVVDGPFAETKELIAGFWIWKVKSMDEAVEWLKKCPNPHSEETHVEIRQIFEAEDFGDAFTPELREQEASIRAQSLGLGDVRFENAPALMIGGINESYTDETRSKIPEQWHRFVPHLGNIHGQKGSSTYGVCWNYTPPCSSDYMTGVEVNGVNLPAGFTKVEIPPRRYAVFTHAGHVSEIPKTMDGIWMKWAPDSGLRIAHAPSFERYTSEFCPDRGTGGIEVWVPLEG